MKIVLVGGSGFVGSRLLEILLKEDNFWLLNIDKRPSSTYPSLSRVGDVRCPESFSSELSDADLVILLAAEHRDDVNPVSLYHEVNVAGLENVLAAMDKYAVRRIIFVSSVAVYGLNKENPDESHVADPFNAYGRSKWEAEELLRSWHRKGAGRQVQIVRPTVIFGEKNRGNVYNLLRQISSRRFVMVGKGENKKSMAYVGNVACFLRYLIHHPPVEKGLEIYNYADKPDFTMNELVQEVGSMLHRTIPKIPIPYPLGLAGGYAFDILALLTGRKFSVSSVRVKKFCATTQFDSRRAFQTGFEAPYSLREGLSRTLRYEFLSPEETVFSGKEKHRKSKDITKR